MWRVDVCREVAEGRAATDVVWADVQVYVSLLRCAESASGRQAECGVGAEDEPLDGRGDTGRGEGGGEAGGAVGGGAGRWRLAGDGSLHHAVLQGGGGVAVAARMGRAPYHRRQDGGGPSQLRTRRSASLPPPLRT